MKKTITLLSILLISMRAFSQWSEVGSAGGMSAGQAWWVSMDFDGTTPYVAYRDCANGCSPTVRTYSNSVWQNVGTAGITGVGSDYVSLVVNQSTPYIAFGDNGNGGKLSVMKYNAGTWSYVGSAGITASAIIGTSIAFDGMGNLYVAYTSGSGSVNVVKWTGSAWTNLAMTGFPVSATNYPQLSFDGSAPCVSYWNGNSEDIHVEKFSNISNSWSAVGSAIAGMAPSKVCFDLSGTPYIAYSNNGNLKAGVVKYNGTSWVSVGSPLSISTVSVGVPTNGIALTMDGNTPYVAYSDLANNGKYSVSTFDGSNWNLVGSSLFSAGGSPFDYCTIKVVSGTPYVAYKAFSTLISNAAAYVMKYSPVTTGLKETQEQDKLSVYPNPANDVLHIGQVAGSATAEILDLTGRLVMVKHNLEQQEGIDISTISPGVYFARITQKNQSSVIKFIKH